MTPATLSLLPDQPWRAAAVWLTELSHTYTVPEQHVVHSGGKPQAASSSTEITFF